MSTEENKAIGRRLAEEFVLKGNLAVADEICATDFVNHSPDLGTMPDREGLKQYVSMMLSAFPDYHGTVEHLIAEGDKVVVGGTFTGTHKGEIMGIPPTGKQITASAISILRIAGGKVVERWNITDRLGVMQQLGVIPTLEQG